MREDRASYFLELFYLSHIEVTQYMKPVSSLGELSYLDVDDSFFFCFFFLGKNLFFLSTLAYFVI